MGEAFITRRGGGIPYAAIGVTYPSGSACTCTNGTLTHTAKDTSGKAVFVIPYAGTWTVKAVSGSNTASKSVSITADGQVATVTLSYWNGQLYDAGNEYTAQTGGWESFNPTGYTLGEATKNSNNLYLKAKYQYEGWYSVAFGTKNKIDLSKFSTLHLNVTATTGVNSGDTCAQMGLCSVKDKTVYSSPVAKVNLPTSAGAATLDISSYTGSYYVFFLAANRSNNTDRTVTTNKIWLT